MNCRFFLAAAESGNFSAAARKLHLTQPAVSQQIQSLEKRLELELFCRDGKRIALTEAGQALVPMARELVNLSAHIEENMAGWRGVVAGRLIIGCTSTPGKYTLAWLVGAFCEQYPQVQVSVEVIKRADILRKLEQQEINLGIMSGQIEQPDLVYQEFMQDDLVLIVPARHPLADQEVVSLDMLRGQTLILREEAAGTRVTMVEGLERAGLSLDAFHLAPLELGAAEGIVSAVEAGWGISWVSMVAAQRAFEMGKIRILEVEGLTLRRMIYLVSHRQRASSNAHLRFYEFVRSPAGQGILRRLGIKGMESAEHP